MHATTRTTSGRMVATIVLRVPVDASRTHAAPNSQLAHAIPIRTRQYSILHMYLYHGLISSIGIVCVPRNPGLRLRMLAHVWPLCCFPCFHVLYHNVLLIPRWLTCCSLATPGGPIRRFHDKTKKHKPGRHMKSFHTEFRTNCTIVDIIKHA